MFIRSIFFTILYFALTLDRMWVNVVSRESVTYLEHRRFSCQSNRVRANINGTYNNTLRQDMVPKTTLFLLMSHWEIMVRVSHYRCSELPKDRIL